MFVKFVWLLAVTSGTVWCQTESSTFDAIDALPTHFKSKVDEKQLNELKNKSLQTFKEKCDKNGGDEAFQTAQNASQAFLKCLENMVNVSVLMTEVQDAKPNGQVDEVFKKYCGKKPEFNICFKDAMESVKPCFTTEERGHLKTVYNVSQQLLDFVCFKDGDRIALFIAEGGPECFEQSQAEIQECANTTLGTELQNVDPNNFTMNSLPQIKFSEKECGMMSELEVCVVKVLQKCPNPTSANIAGALFKFVRKATPCKNFRDPADPDKDSANGPAVTSLTIIMALSTTLFL